MTERQRHDRYKDYETADPAVSFVLDGGVGSIRLDASGVYPPVTPKSTYARGMSAFTPIPEKRKAEVRQEIDSHSDGSVALGQMLRTEYAGGVASNSTENITHFTDVLYWMTEDPNFRELVLRALESDAALKESLYRAERGEATPGQRLHLLQELPGLEAIEVSRRSFTLDDSSNLLDKIMMAEVHAAIVERGGEVYARPHQVRLPKLRAAEALMTEIIPRKSSVIFTTKYDIAKLPMANSSNDITVRLRQKHLATIEDLDIQDAICMMREQMDDPYDVGAGIVKLQNLAGFIEYCQNLVKSSGTRCLSSIVYGFSQGIQRNNGISMSALKNAADAIINEAVERHVLVAPENRRHEVVGDKDIARAEQEIRAQMGRFAVMSPGDIVDIIRATKENPVLYEVMGAAYVRAHRTTK